METNKITSGAAKESAVAVENEKKSVSQVGNIIMSLIMAAIGLTLIFLHDRHVVGTTILYIAGAAFVIPGAWLLLSLLIERKNSQRGSVMNFMTAICGLAALTVGIVIMVIPDMFRHLIVYLFGGLIILAAAWQFDVMMRRNRGVYFPVWLVVAAVVLVALGVVLCTLDLFRGETNERWMLLVSGIGFTLFGLIGLCVSYYALKSAHQAKKEAREAAAGASETSASVEASASSTAEESHPVEDVEAKEV